MAEHPELRIGDRDRQLVVDHLRTNLGEGRLTLDEFEERAGLAFAARTVTELRAVTADLPAVTTPTKGPPIRVRQPAVLTPWDKAYRIHKSLWALLSVFFVVLWMLTGAGYFWPVWPILGIGLSVGVHGAVKKAVQG